VIQANDPDDNKHALQRQPDPQPPEIYRPRPWAMPVTAGVLTAVGGGGLGWFIYLSRAIADVGTAYSFVAQNTLSLFIFLAVVAQALIYWGHRNLMLQQSRDTQQALDIERAKIAPRLRVDEVRVAGFEDGRSPAFIVTLVNDGATEAQDVALYVQAEHKQIRAEWRGEQIITIPANGRKMYPIRWTPVLNQQVIDAYNDEPRLKVFGYFRYKDTQQPFCCHYYPWIGKRPAEVPYFVPCDFDVRNDVNIGLEIQDSTHDHVADSVTLTVQDKPPEKASPQKEGEPDGKEDSNRSIPNGAST